MATPTLDRHMTRGSRPMPRWLRALRIVHPFPTLLNVAAVGGLSLVAADGLPDSDVLLRMLVVMLFAQCAIGIANDICDRDLDAAAKPWKPIAAGLVSVPVAVISCAVLIAAAGAIALTLGWSSFTLAMLGLACGLAYDVRLKRTLASAVPFMIAIPTLPIWVWVSLDAWEPVLWWMWPLGGLIGLSLHLANTLPDIDDDAAHGVRGLAHALGANGTRRLASLSFAGALVLALVAGLPHTANEWLLFGAVGVGAVTLVGSIVVQERRRDTCGMQAGFALMAVGAAIAATGWVAAVT